MPSDQKPSLRAGQTFPDTFIDGMFNGTDWNRLHAMVRHGLTQEAYGASTVHRFLALCLVNEEMRTMLRRLIVPERSWKRRIGGRSPLSASEMERMIVVGEVVRETRRLYGGNTAAAETFLLRPHHRFAGQPPILVAATEGGAQAVRELLARMEEGAPA